MVSASLRGAWQVQPGPGPGPGGDGGQDPGSVIFGLLLSGAAGSAGVAGQHGKLGLAVQSGDSGLFPSARSRVVQHRGLR